MIKTVKVESVKLEDIRQLERQNPNFIVLPCGCKLDKDTLVRVETCNKHFLYGAR